MSARSSAPGRAGRALGARAERHAPARGPHHLPGGGPAALFVEPADEDDWSPWPGPGRGGRAGAGAGARARTCWWPTPASTGWSSALGPGFGSAPAIRTARCGPGRRSPPRAGPPHARRPDCGASSGPSACPGSVGGAIRMNAGGHGSDTAASWSPLRWVDLAPAAVDESPARRLGPRLPAHRARPPPTWWWAEFGLAPGDPAEAGRPTRRDRALAAGPPARREQRRLGLHQPRRGLGRPPDRGVRAEGLPVGSAEVSAKHANFIQADPGGSADDVCRLIAHVRSTVAGGHRGGAAHRGPPGRFRVTSLAGASA